MSLNQGRILNPATTSLPDMATPDIALGKQGEQLASELHGKYYTINKRGGLYTANVAAVTVPTIAATLVSVFSLYNPRNSGIDMELIDFDITTVLATLVVNTYGLYFSADKNADTSTFTAKGTALSCRIDGGPVGNKGQFYSALTHVGTPVLWRILGGDLAVTSTQVGGIHVDFDGKAIIPPGTVVSLATTTAAATTSGTAAAATWAEWPTG